MRRSRYDRRFYAVGAVVLGAAIVGKLLGADAFAEYPAIEIGVGPATLVLAILLVLSGLAPRASSLSSRTASNSLPARPRI